MALTIDSQETLETEEEKPRIHLICDNVTSGQYKMQDAQLCRICFATSGNLFSMKMDKNLNQAYGTLTGLSIENEENMPPYLCMECSHQLMHCNNFRNRSLRSHLLLLEILQKHEYITLEMIKSVNECQEMNTLNLDMTHKSIDQSDLETIHIKKENVYIDKQICLRNESRSLEIVFDGIKKEDNYTLSQDDPKDEDIVYSSSVHDDILLENIKAEKDDMYNEEGITASDDRERSVEFKGEDGSDHNILVGEQRHKAKLNIAKVKGVTKTAKGLKQKSGDRVSLYNNLCCNMCSYKTVSDEKLLRHLKIHTSTKSYKCTYTTSIRQKVYSTEQGFSCHVCNKTFSRKWGLQKHMKTHFGGKQYTCDVCKKGFNENRDLQNHLRTHSGEKPFGCDLCKKSFSERGNLLRHIRIHAGEKPYACKICKISFNQKHHLTRHLTKHY